MIFNINYEFEDRGVYLFTTDLSTEYRVTFREGDYTTIGIYITSYSKYDSEVFKTIETLKFILNRVKSNRFLINIEDRDPELRRRKLSILKRCLTNFEYTVVENPHLPAIGRNTRNTILNITQVYLIKKKELKQKRYCPNCGSENNDYKFCPSCGTNLQ